MYVYIYIYIYIYICIRRLANYKYFNMDDSIDNALSLFSKLEGDTITQKMLSNTTSAPPETETKISKEKRKILRQKFPGNQTLAKNAVSHRVQHKSESFGKMTVHIIVALYKENIHWVGGACGVPILLRHDVETHWFFYVKYAKRDLEVLRNELDATWGKLNCSFPHVHIRYLDNLGRESHTYMSHLFLSSFRYGDANIFVQGHCSTGFGNVACAAQHVYERLYRHNISREKDLTDAEIMRVPSGELGMYKRRRTPCLPYTNIHIKPFMRVWDQRFNAGMSVEMHRLLDKYRAHVARTDDFRVKDVKTVNYLNKTVISLLEVYFLKAEFMVTGALIRRAMQMNMNVLWEAFEDLSVSKNPPAGYSMEMMWLDMFIQQTP